jgi:hypothetical protein
MIIHQDIYDGSLIHSRFAYKFFKEKVNPRGNIVAFVAPMKVEAEHMVDLEDVMNNDFIYSDKAINFCYELPLTNLFGGVCFQRLFTSYVANALVKYGFPNIQIEGDDIFIIKEFKKDNLIMTQGKASVSIVCERNGAILGHIGINIHAGDKAPNFAFSTELSDEQSTEFMADIVNSFTNLVSDIFIATTKVI